MSEATTSVLRDEFGNPVKWGDFSSSSSDESESSTSGSNEDSKNSKDIDQVFQDSDEEVVFIKPGKINKDVTGCCPNISLCSGTSSDFLKSLICVFKDQFSDRVKIRNLSHECLMNVLRNTCYWMNKLSDEVDDSYKSLILQNFLKFRHEVLAINLSKMLGLDQEKTDVSFRDFCSIDSDRTPDFIFKGENNKIHIVEVSAVTDVERASISKGDVSLGYVSKYSSEILELESKGNVVTYDVIIFDISNKDSKDHEFKIKRMFERMNKIVSNSDLSNLDYYRIEFINYTKIINKRYGKYYSTLFNETYEINMGEIDNLEGEIFGSPVKEFTGFYKRVGVSKGIYESVIKNCQRLIFRLENLLRLNNDDSKFELDYDLLRSRFLFRKSKKGLSLSDWFSACHGLKYDFLCENLTVVLTNSEIKTPKSDFEFFSYVKNEIKPMVDLEVLDHQIHHQGSFEPFKNIALEKLESVESDLKYKNLSTIYEDDDYEEKILKSISKMDKSNDFDYENLKPKPFSCYEVCEESIKTAVEKYKENYLLLNEPTDSFFVPHCKQPFIFPIYDVRPGSYSNFKTKPIILNWLKDRDLGPYTNRIISIISQDFYNFGSSQGVLKPKDNYMLELATLQREINGKLKEIYRKRNYKKYPKMNELENYSDYKIKLQSLNNQIRKRKDEEKSKIPTIRLPSKPNTDCGRDFEKEMLHFREKKIGKQMKGVARMGNFPKIESDYQFLKEHLKSPSGIKCPDDFLDERVSKDVSLLEDLKKEYIIDNKGFIDWLKGTNLYHSCAFVSRFCHTLLYHSQTTFNSDYIIVDNLGYNDVLLIMKGGKKIFSTRKSKLFKLIMPISDQSANLYSCSGLPSSQKIIHNKNLCFLVTPWMNFHETVLADGLTFLHRTMGFLVISKEPSMSFDETFETYIFNVLLSFHNRRKTEVFLHNIRYIMMNSMSDFSAIEEILPELAGFNYDLFQFFIRESILKNFFDFSTKLKKLHDKNKPGKFLEIMIKEDLKHPFNGHKLNTLSQLSSTVYSTYLMSKAPTVQAQEQVSNMKNILKTHNEFNKNYELGWKDPKLKVTLNEDFNLQSYYNELMSEDFKYDPKYCVLLGKFMGDYISNLTTEGELYTIWDNVLAKNWDAFSNTKGLRGDSNLDNDFFGNKGYYIVYKKVIEENPGFVKTISGLLNSDLDPLKIKKELKKLNEPYRKRMVKEEMDLLIFHVVDKIQRGGGREIYVMDRKTKMGQQPIEDFIGKLCKKIPNEMISIPSNKRLMSIHSKVFEGGGPPNTDPYYLVLDCRKWAPKSLVQKFILFLTGMRKIIPSGFLKHCYHFFNLMIRKRIYTRPYIVNQLKHNSKYSSNISYFIEDDSRNGFYLDMDYSWVMGIFNYFSSFMHVAVQLHASHICRHSFSQNLNEEFNLHMVAHSDDSAGKAYAKSKDSMKRALFIYETLMKSSNHLISKKKSNCGKVYYEFLSILYISGNLLSMIVKFSGIFNFHPTDKGYCSDINECYSKCLELLLNGSTMSQAYLGLKIQAHLIRRFYFNKNPEENLYEMPPKMMGIPDAHPIMVLMCGSDSDTLRIMYKKSEKERKIIYKLNDCLSTGLGDNEGFLRSFDCSPNVWPNPKILKLINDNSEVYDLAEGSWTIKNVNFKNTQINAVQFILKLKDKNFIAALQDENISRRISRAFHFRVSPSIKTKYGDLTLKQFSEILLHLFFVENESALEFVKNEVVEDVKRIVEESEGEGFEIYNGLFEMMFDESLKLYRYLENLKFKKENLKIFTKTIKPLHIKMIQTIEKPPFKFDSSSLCSWIKEPKFRMLLPDTRNYQSLEVFLRELCLDFGVNLDELTEDQIYNLILRMDKRSTVEYHCYSNVPSSMREVSTYQDLLNLLAHNSFQGKYIEGITLKFGKMIGVVPEQILGEIGNEKSQWCLSMLFLLRVLSEHPDFEIIMNLTVKTPDFISEKDVLMLQIPNLIDKSWRKNKEIFEIIRIDILAGLHGCKLRKLTGEDLEDSYFHSFVKRQFLIGNSWSGTAKLFISLGKLKLCFIIRDNYIVKVIGSDECVSISNFQIRYINLCLSNAQVSGLNEYMRNIEFSDYKKLFLGIDETNNYKVDTGEHLKMGLDFDQDFTLSTTLSKPSMGTVKVDDRGKIKWIKESEFEKEVYYIKTLPIEPVNSIMILDDLVIDNKENRELIRQLSPELEKDIQLFCLKKLSIDLKINKESLVENYKNSRIAKILRECLKSGKCTVYPKKVNKKTLPAPDGGLLNVLINYSDLDENFDFDWGRNLTPSYVRLKSTQPEAFVTEIMVNIKEKYENLYSGEDKEIMMKELIKISKDSDDPDFATKLTSSLCNWGYIGVAGSLQSLKMEISSENFNQIRDFGPKSPFSDSYSNIYISLLKNIYDSIEEYLNTNHEIKLESPNWFYLNKRSLKSFFVSLSHNETLMSFGGKNKNNSFLDTHDYVMSGIMLSLMSLIDLREIFVKELKNSFLINNLPVGKGYYENWCIVYSTLRNYYRRSIYQNKEIDVAPRFVRDEGMIQPFNITKSLLLKLGIEISSAKIYHHGALDQSFMDKFRGRKFSLKGSQRIVIDCQIVDHKTIKKSPKICFNEKLFFMHKFTEDFLDSEAFEDLEIELVSSETSMEAFEDIKNDYEGEIFEKEVIKRINSFYKGKVERTLKISVFVIFDFTFTKFGRVIDKMRQISESLMLFTTNYLSEDEKSEFSSKVLTFRVSRSSDEGKSMIMKSLINCYIISPFKDRRIWENAFPLIKLESENYNDFPKVKVGSIKTSDGVNINMRKISRQKSLLNNKLMAEEFEAEESKRKELENNELELTKLEKSKNLLISKGFDEKIITKYIDDIKEKSNGWEDLLTVLNKILENEEQMNKLIKNLELGVEDSIGKTMTKEQNHRIYQVPHFLSLGSSKESDYQSKALKDPELIAEINSVFPDFMNKIITNRLCVSEKMKTRYTVGLRNLSRSIKSIKKNKQGKNFLLNLFKLIINDANQVPNGTANEDEQWQESLDWISEKIDEEEDEDEENDNYFKNILGEEDDHAKIVYKRLLERV